MRSRLRPAVALSRAIARDALVFCIIVIGAQSAFAADSGGSDALLTKQGRYLATAGDCISCHTRAGGEPFAGGRALDTPFGVIHSANITPDVATGIGRWSEADLARAMREGIAADGTHLYPAFPYTAYTKVTDADVHAIFAYLRSLKPVRYSPPGDRMHFPFSVRGLLAAWNLMFLEQGRYVADPARSAEWNRGAYLVQGLEHCGACHTPRNVLGGEQASLALTGAEYLDTVADEVVDGRITPMDERTVRPWSAANLTSAASGLKAWSVEALVDYLKTGHSPRAAAFGPMSEVVANSTSHLSAADLKAIAVYLKSFAPAPASRPDSPSAERMKAGEAVFSARCGDCHLPSGLGMPRSANTDASKTAPPLAGSAALQAPSPATLINVILYGAHERQASDGSWPKMSGFELAVGLDDEAIADLGTYVRASWGNQAGAVSASAVARQR
ncbi:MAG TPA: c-type cytochrome [Steroidobacteraceae bacterium]|jgi:mono/diheme cytochrome c family protein|nr:c-type cytochrome [Steroidobacteraceae bacterium]